MSVRASKWLAAFVALAVLVAGEIVVSSGTGAQASIGDGGSFVTVSPARIADTAAGTGFSSSGAFSAGSSKTLKVTGTGEVPSTGVGAVVIDIAGRSTAASRLSVYPSDEARGLAALSLGSGNDWDSTTVLVKPGADGRIRVYNEAGTTSVNIDIQGYFTESSTSSSTGGYVPVTPTRVVNSDTNTGLNGPLTGGTTYSVQVAGNNDIPEDATGIYASLRVFGATGEGGLRAVSSNITPGTGTASVLNYGPTASFDTGAAIDLGTDGKLKLWASAGTTSLNVILDVQGYFTAGTNGASFHPISNERVYDSSSAGNLGALDPGETRTIDVSGNGSVPDDGSAGGAALAITVKDWTGSGSISVYHADRENANGTASVAFGGSASVARQSTSFVDFNGDGQVKIRNNSGSGKVTVLMNAQGWFNSEPLEDEELNPTDAGEAPTDVAPLPCPAGTTSCEPSMIRGTANGTVSKVTLSAIPAAAEAPDAPADVEFEAVPIPTSQVLKNGSTFTVRVDPDDVPGSVVQPDGLVAVEAAVETTTGEADLSVGVQAVDVQGSTQGTVWADPTTTTPSSSSTGSTSPFGTATTRAQSVKNYTTTSNTPDDQMQADVKGTPATVNDQSGYTAMNNPPPQPMGACTYMWLNYYKTFTAKSGGSYPSEGARSTFRLSSHYSKTYGSSVSLTASGGWNVEQGGNRTISGGTTITWEGFKKSKRYTRDVEYRKRRKRCPNGYRWYYKPWIETEQALSHPTTKPTFPEKYCSLNNSGNISRNSTSGHDYTLSRGVDAKALKVKLHVTRTWEASQYVEYTWKTGETRKVCGTNARFSIASTAGMKPR